MAYFKLIILGENGIPIETRELDLPYQTAEQAMASNRIQSLKNDLLKNKHGIQLKRVNRDGEGK